MAYNNGQRSAMVQPLNSQRSSVSYNRRSQSGTRTGRRAMAPGQSVAAKVRRNTGQGRSPSGPGGILTYNVVDPAPISTSTYSVQDPAPTLGGGGTELLGPPPTARVGRGPSSSPVHPSVGKRRRFDGA